MPNMSMIMSQFQVPLSFGTALPPFLESQYYLSTPAPIMTENPPRGPHCLKSRSNIPLSPSSSAGEFRVSKAKKGKRVHACEWPGCGKIFTRAEHRRRHELSHKSKKNFVCAYDGCIKAFHRADYLAQHMARHEPKSTIEIAPSIPTTSTSPTNSARSDIQTYSNSSPVMPEYQSPTSDTSAGTPEQPEKIMMDCFSCPNQTHRASHHDAPLFNYPVQMGNTTNANESLFPADSSTPQFPSGFESIIENYMRSILKPEAFLTAVQPAGQASSPFWNSNIDPSLPQLGSSAFQASATPYSWTSGAENLSSTFHTAPQIPEASPRPEGSS